jgi:phage gpG-like protein
MQDLFKNLMTDVRKNLDDEFDKNFQNKGFFGDPWEQRKLQNRKGSLMMVQGGGGGLRGSLRSQISGESITWSSSLPYASIHNEGGEITVTKKMKSFFWAMYYKSAGAISYSIKTKKANATKKNQQLSEEAQQWKYLALMKLGQKIKMPKRQFIGDHPEVKKHIEFAINSNLPDLEKYMLNLLKQRP